MTKQILVLDDSPFMLTLIGDMLKNLNYGVTTVDCPTEACRQVETTRFDMIITDLNMPVMDGLEFTRRVKSNPKNKFVPVVMLSSEGDDNKVALAKECGVSTFLNKPPKESQLRTLLQITLSKRRFQRLPVKLEVRYGNNPQLTQQAVSRTFNMSAGGLFLETDQLIPVGEMLQLTFSIPGNSAPVQCQARVAWVNERETPINATHPTGLGLEFIEFNETRLLQDFLTSGAWKTTSSS